MNTNGPSLSIAIVRRVFFNSKSMHYFYNGNDMILLKIGWLDGL